ncbi:Cerevisin [Wickerhamiella sorbophila]|uniref:Cerevisin n=1 Tax=Wickerhamiella sorbophila TaxID=45607 RepID=A0A2T0FNA6_9ASCO|nr:Cerevisin [Wickerhamiella sorbophila]PRT56464.1 Cerevisin [Wickerhamiella sorbophila]
MVRAEYLIAALPLVNALYIPHAGEELATFDGPQPKELDDAKLPSLGRKPHRTQGHSQRRPVHMGGKQNKVAPVKVPTTKVFPSENGKADVIAPVSHDGEDITIKNKYIIVFDDSVTPADVAQHFGWLNVMHAEHMSMIDAKHPLASEESTGLLKTFDLGDTFRGYSGSFLPETIEAIRESPIVKHIEQDSIVRVSEASVENGAPWGLARVSHRKALSLGTFNKYLYDAEGGEGVTAYVVDTGIYIDHEDFEGRATWGKTIPVGDVDKDAHGHGSHCAGTMVGKKFGVAKKANVVAVKVLGSDGSGTMSDVIGGVEYVVASHKKEQASNSKHKGSTANMSLGGGKSPSLELAVSAAVNQGVHFAVAAGNENQDACNVSPAGASEPVTVGATDLSDDRAYFSNWGKCVDIFAPGVNVLSVGTTDPTSTAIMSGTSMASPHIAGLLSYFLSLQPDSDSEYATSEAITPRQLKQNLISFGTPGVISDLDSDSPNVLAYNGAGKGLSALWSGSNDTTEELDEEDVFTLKHITDLLLEELEAFAGKTGNLFGELRVALDGTHH